jgi:long-chain acyl-CoA synthetase
MILDEKGKECPPGVDGRVCSRTAMTINLEYSGTPFHTIEGKEYFDDELIGHVDEDGFLYLVEREKDMIISGGVNIFPWRIEERILNHPKVADVAVIGIPHPDLGEVAHAEVQLKEGETATPDEIIEHCRKEGLSGYNLPKSLNFVGKLPRHIDGKLLKREIRKKYWGELREEGRL